MPVNTTPFCFSFIMMLTLLAIIWSHVANLKNDPAKFSKAILRGLFWSLVVIAFATAVWVAAEISLDKFF
jgi:hypothetical protein